MEGGAYNFFLICIFGGLMYMNVYSVNSLLEQSEGYHNGPPKWFSG